MPEPSRQVDVPAALGKAAPAFGITLLLSVFFSVCYGLYLMTRPTVWDLADWDRLTLSDRSDLLNRNPRPDAAVAVPGWDLTYSKPVAYAFDADEVLAIKFNSFGNVSEWKLFSGNAAEPKSLVVVKEGAR